MSEAIEWTRYDTSPSVVERYVSGFLLCCVWMGADEL